MSVICLENSTLKIKEPSKEKMRLNLLSGELLIADNIFLDKISIDFWKHVRSNIHMLPIMYHKKVKRDTAKKLLKNGIKATPNLSADLSPPEYNNTWPYLDENWTLDKCWASGDSSTSYYDYKVNYNSSGTTTADTYETWRDHYSTSANMLYNIPIEQPQYVYYTTLPSINKYYFDEKLLISESASMISFPNNEQIILAIDGSNLHIKSNMKRPWNIFNSVIINNFDLKAIFDRSGFKSV